MAVVIRLKRTGRRNLPCYRIHVTDSRAPRGGRSLENLGHYDPVSTDPEAQVRLDPERAKHWLSMGALPSDTVRSLFKRTGVFEGATKKAPRKRTGRGKTTATRKQRRADQTVRSERKVVRAKARLEARRAAAKAAPESEES